MTIEEAIERVIATHQIDRGSVEVPEGKDEKEVLLMRLADGEFGGLSSSKFGTPEKPTMIQIARLNRLAQQVFPEFWQQELRDFIRILYKTSTDNTTPLMRVLTRRQAARVIIELDRVKENRVC
ncbi:MAG: hypothetical protein F4175_20315 [Gemmatimonadetes bacterium]|nr:hypothetical protein [Gemmatimonadota bacterium]